MRKKLFVVGLLAVFGMIGVSRAEPATEAASRAKLAAPFVDEATVGLAHVDLARIQPDALVAQLVRVYPTAAPQLEELKQRLEKLLSAFRQGGGKELYVIFSFTDIPEAWFFVVPLSDASKPEMLAALLRSLGAKASQRVGDVLVAGDKRTVARIRGLRPDERPELAQAFAAAGDSVAQLLVLPPKHAPRVVEELLPVLPAEIGGGPSSVFTQGLRWAAIGVTGEAGPSLSLHAVIQSQNAQAAAALGAKLDDMAQLAGRLEVLRQRAPRIDELLRVLLPKVQGDRLILTLDVQNQGIATLLAAMDVPLEEARSRARQAASMNQLKQLALAMHVYHDLHNAFPAQASYSADGKPLLSWRVHLLPMLEQTDLYNQFHLNEPWDSAHNRELIAKMPAIFRSPGLGRKEPGLTSYVVPVGPATAFPGREAKSVKEITDGTSNTIMIVEAVDSQAVIWTKPDDLAFDPQQPDKGLGGPVPGGFLAAFCDGSVQFLKLPEDPQNLRALFTRNGGEAVQR
jgi:hypothetical protein